MLPYTRLYVSEYNAILFRAAPVRTLPDTPEINGFITDVDGEGNSINEFMSMVDVYTTVFGVVWVSCIKTAGADYARWRMHTPIDVVNWKYGYTPSGDLELTKIVIRTATEPDLEIYQYITKDTIETVFVPFEEDADIDVPLGSIAIEGDDGKTIYRISQPNELGYIPVRPVYQSTKIYNGVGHTPIFDIAQLQRSIYGDFGEIYSAVSYGAHPVNIIDEATMDLNNNNVGAEPGTTIKVQSSLNGQPSYVFEFVAPPLDSITELRELVEQKIEKMNQVAMIRSEELIKASRSGVQIEMYDSKLEAFIRKKATSLENVEAHSLWPMWFDWQGLAVPEDLTVSYNRLYSNRGLQQEIAEVTSIMNLVSEYESRFVKEESESEQEESQEYAGLDALEAAEVYATQAEAEARAAELGGAGFHTHDEDGVVIYMPFPEHEQLRAALMAQMDRESTDEPDMESEDMDSDESEEEFLDEMKEKIRARMKQLIDSSFSENSL